MPLWYDLPETPRSAEDRRFTARVVYACLVAIVLGYALGIGIQMSRAGHAATQTPTARGAR